MKISRALFFIFFCLIPSRLFAFSWGGVEYDDSQMYSVVSELEKQQKNIQNEIINKFNTEFHNSAYNKTPLQKLQNAEIEGPITDGLTDIKKYLQSEVKIMWILKEPYDGIKTNGKLKTYSCSGWSITDNVLRVKPNELLEGRSKNTWLPIAYVTQGVKNKYSNMSEIMQTENSILCENLQSIAYINLSKVPQDTTTDDNTLPWKYEFWREILLKQIKLYKPDIIIFGNTFKYFKDDLTEFGGIWDFPASDVSFSSWKIMESKNTLYIGAYHPQYSSRRVHGCTPETYCETIVNIILDFTSQRNRYLESQDAA